MEGVSWGLCHVTFLIHSVRVSPRTSGDCIVTLSFPCRLKSASSQSFISNQRRVRRAGRAALRRDVVVYLRTPMASSRRDSPCAHVQPPSRSHPSGGPATLARRCQLRRWARLCSSRLSCSSPGSPSSPCARREGSWSPSSRGFAAHPGTPSPPQ